MLEELSESITDQFGNKPIDLMKDVDIMFDDQPGNKLTKNSLVINQLLMNLIHHIY